MNAPKIKIDRLAKVFGEDERRTTALQDFTLSVGEGEFVCVVGPSGCGKTTMLRIVAGLEKSSSGSLAIAPGADKGRPQNAMVFQEQGLFPWMTVIDNVAYGLEMRGIGKRERQERAEPFLEMIGLTRFRNHYPQQLSGGMRQRVSIARAFVADPEILLMDEPFAALDAQNKLIMQDELLRIWEGTHKTVLFITHAVDEAIALGDRIVVMTAQPGRIKAIVPVDQFPRPRKAVELRGDPRFGALQLEIWRMLEDEVRTQRLQAKS
ncbi:MAG TPA: ABC transporter ATP-binding protein [Reyranella sp.]|nr:ABC transporter ATP-binding protein [Reyranella sp.]